MKKEELERIIQEYLYNSYFDDFRIVFKLDKRGEDSLRNKIYRLKVKLEEARLLGESYDEILTEAEEEFAFFVEANSDTFKKGLREKTIQTFSNKFKDFIEAING